LKYFFLLSLLVAATVVDLKYRIIPDKLNLAGLLFGMPFLFVSREAFFSGAAGFLVGGGLLLLVAVVSRGGMGGGDIKLAAVIGLYLGWEHLLLALFLAFIAGGTVGILMLLLRLKKMKDTLPFGPCLALGAMAAVLIKGNIVQFC
jgi:leader peptidase (prepilin peptidase)/N-methyltransferase